MKKAFLVMAAAAAFAASAEPAETNENVTTEAVISEVMQVIKDEGWNAEDVADAIKSLRGLYLRDTATQEGRRRWHGQKTREVVNTNTLEKTTYYEDGTIFTDQAKVTTPAQAAQQQLARLPPPVMTNGIPTRLANARLRQRENSMTTNEVVVVLKAGGDK